MKIPTRPLALALVAAATWACTDTPVSVTPERAPVAAAAPMASAPLNTTPLPALTYVVEDLLPGTAVDRFAGGVLVGEAGEVVILTTGGDHLYLDGAPVPMEGAATGLPFEIGPGGRVVGWSFQSGFLEPAAWDAGALSILPGGAGTAFDINSAGTVLGVSGATAGDELLIWSAGGALQRSVVPGYHLVVPRYVNGRGDVLMTGFRVDPGSGQTVVETLVWNGGVVHALPSVCVDMQVVASRGSEYLNDAGQAIGTCRWGSGQWYWDGSAASVVPTLGGASTSLRYINAAGTAVGWSNDPTGALRAVTFDGASLTDLGLMGGDNSRAVGIDDAGGVTGLIQTAGVFQSFVTEAGVPRLLPTLGGPESFVRDISASGLIVGSAQDGSGAYRAVVWRPASRTRIVANIQARLDALVAGGSIGRGPARAMRATLDAGALLGFIRQVEGLVAGGLVDPEVGRAFIEAARTARSR